jgi:ligand-binding SRPBCC domain-containing protein
MKTHEFTTELWLSVPPEKLFPFFGNAANLNTLTPPWLSFRIEGSPPNPLRAGTLIDYRLRVRGLPMRWRTRINEWEPPHRFVDEQIRGPYRLWIHEHSFVSQDGGTLARDHVRYAVPLDWVLHRWFVRPDIVRIFDYRARVLENLFSGSGRALG